MRFLIACAFLAAAAPAAASPLGSFPIWTQFGQSTSFYGASVSRVGDVNGDGYDDVAIGAKFYDNGQTDEGGAWLYLGSPAGPDTTADWHVEGNQSGAQMGFAVAGAGDVNHDGFDDLLIGTPGANRAQLHLGSAAGPALTPSWFSVACCSYGNAVATAGDVNADGFDDVIIGGVNGGTAVEGIAQVFHGSATGLGSIPAAILEGNQDFARLGFSVAAAGDVNGDGFADVIVGAPDFSNGEFQEGKAVVYHGSAAGVSLTPAWTVESDQPDTYLGISVAGAGDVNRDGYGDVIAGANWWSQGVSNDDGRATVYLGSPAGLATTPVFTTYGTNSELGFSVDSAGDLNADGYDDIVVGVPHYQSGQPYEGASLVFLGSANGPSPAPDWIAELNLETSHLGQCSAGAGDVNGDGFDDLVLGAPYSHCPPPPGFPPCGPIPAFAVIYLGQATEVATPDAAPPPPAALALRVAPNPFAHATWIEYALSAPASVGLHLFDAAGRARAVLVSGRAETGPHTITFDGRDSAGDRLVPGVYFLQLTAGDHTAVEKLIVIR
jgi:FG-GAP repeat protein